ncbi:MAG: hypothetical protein AB1758_20205, partial [Candidatus Eremiobacterota bacterium]
MSRWFRVLALTLLMLVPALGQAPYQPPVPFNQQRQGPNMQQAVERFRQQVNRFRGRDAGYEFSTLWNLGNPTLLLNHLPTTFDGSDQQYEVFVLDGQGQRCAYSAGIPALTWKDFSASMFADNRWDVRSQQNGRITLNNDILLTREAWNDGTNGDMTCWHEANHGALFRGGGVSVDEQPDDEDDQHSYIVYYAEKTVYHMEAYLKEVEDEMARVNAQPAPAAGSSQEAQLWGPVNMLWRQFLSACNRDVRELSQAERDEYTRLTGVRLPTPEELAARYRTGRYLRKQGRTPPAWVFDDKGDVPTFIFTDGPAASSLGEEYRLALDVRSGMGRTTFGRPDGGQLTVAVQEASPSASFQVDAENGARTLVDGVRSWDYDLAGASTGDKPFLLTLKVDDLQLAHGKDLHVSITYSGFKDPKNPDRSWSPSGTRVTIPIRKTAKLQVSGPATVDAEAPLALSVQAVDDKGKRIAVDPARKPRFRWTVFNRYDYEGDRVDIPPRPARGYDIPVALFVEVKGKEMQVAETTYHLEVTDKTVKDPKQEAEATLRWLQEVELYLKELLELDKLTILQTERKCGDNHARQILAKNKDKYSGMSKQGAASALAEEVLAEQMRLKCMERPTEEHHQHQKDLKATLGALEDSRLAGDAFKEYAGFNDYKGYLEAVKQLKTRFKVTIPQPLPKPARLPWSYSLACSSDQGGVADQVLVTLQVMKKTVKPGERVVLTADVTGGNPPYAFRWSPDPAADGPTFTYSSRTRGPRDVTVTVTDSAGKQGIATVRLTVSDFTCQVTASAKSVPVGGTVRFEARVLEDGKPVRGGSFTFRWQPHPEVSFDRLDSQEPAASAAFPRPGQVGVWVQVLEKDGAGNLVTVTESGSVSVQVVQPSLKIVLVPAQPLVGQEAQARLVLTPDTPSVDVRWLPLASHGVLVGESQDSRTITFYVKEPKALDLQALARTPVHGDDLGEARISVSPVPFQVVVDGPKTVGAKPRVFKPGVGLVEAEGQLAVGQTLTFRALVRPTPGNPPLRYTWTSGPACRLSNPAVAEPTVTCSATGNHELTVEVRDSRDVVLGRGSATFTVALSSMDGGGAARVGTLLDEARKLTRAGKFVEAAGKAVEADELDPKAAAPVLAEIVAGAKKTGWEKLGSFPVPAIDDAIGLFELAVKLAPKDEDARKKLAQAQQARASYGRMLELLATLRSQLAARKVITAYQTLKAMSDSQQGLRGSPGILNQANLEYDDANKAMNRWVMEHQTAW